MKSKLTCIVSFCGCPGLPDDLNDILQPWQQMDALHADILVGYSRGGLEALWITAERCAAGNPPKAVIWIAPDFLSASSLLFRILLIIPQMENWMWQKFAIRTTKPDIVPHSYEERLKKYSQKHCLQKAMKWKPAPHSDLKTWTRTLQQQNELKMLAIHGEADKFDTLHFLQNNFPKLQMKTIPRAGHALPWTHPIELQNILTTFMESIYHE